jgi:hypothetical protein
VVTGINIDRPADGKLVEHWGEANTVGMLTQLGYVLFPTTRQCDGKTSARCFGLRATLRPLSFYACRITGMKTRLNLL